MQSSTWNHHHHIRPRGNPDTKNLRPGFYCSGGDDGGGDPSHDPSISLGLSLHHHTAPSSSSPSPPAPATAAPSHAIPSPSALNSSYMNHASNSSSNGQAPSWATSSLSNTISNYSNWPSTSSSSFHALPKPMPSSGPQPSSSSSSSSTTAAPSLIPLELLPLRPSNSPASSSASSLLPASRNPALASHSPASFFWPPPPPAPAPVPIHVPIQMPGQAPIFSSSLLMPYPLHTSFSTIHNPMVSTSSHSPSPSPSPSPKITMMRGLDMNQPPANFSAGDHDEVDATGRTSESNSCLNVKRDRERSVGVLSDGAEHEHELEERTCEVSSRGSDEDMEVADGGSGGGSSGRKKLRLTKEQSTLLEESFKEHSTLNPKQKAELAKQLSLRPRQVEVWFQNRRARTKLKQTEVDCELLKRCCESLTEENRRLQKEVAELRAMKVGPPCVISRDLYMPLPAATLTMCPSCERLATHTTTSGGVPSAVATASTTTANANANASTSAVHDSGSAPLLPPSASSSLPSFEHQNQAQQQQGFNHMMAAAAAAAASNLNPASNHFIPAPPSTSSNPSVAPTTSNGNNSNVNSKSSSSRSSSPNSNPGASSSSTPTPSSAAHFAQYRFSPPPLPSAAC